MNSSDRPTQRFSKRMKYVRGRLPFNAAILLVLWCASPLFSASSSGESPEPGGVWIGVMTQPGGPYESYRLRLELSEDGGVLIGASRIEIPGSDWYGVMSVTGERFGDSVIYRERRMISEHIPPEISWCMKHAWLRLIPARDSTVSDSLVGRWGSPPCLPGRISLVRSDEPRSLSAYTPPTPDPMSAPESAE